MTCTRDTEGKFPHTLHINISNVGGNSGKIAHYFLDLQQEDMGKFDLNILATEISGKSDYSFSLPIFLVYPHSAEERKHNKMC